MSEVQHTPDADLDIWFPLEVCPDVGLRDRCGDVVATIHPEDHPQWDSIAAFFAKAINSHSKREAALKAAMEFFDAHLDGAPDAPAWTIECGVLYEKCREALGETADA